MEKDSVKPINSLEAIIDNKKQQGATETGSETSQD